MQTKIETITRCDLCGHKAGEGSVNGNPRGKIVHAREVINGQIFEGDYHDSANAGMSCLSIARHSFEETSFNNLHKDDIVNYSALYKKPLKRNEGMRFADSEYPALLFTSREELYDYRFVQTHPGCKEEDYPSRQQLKANMAFLEREKIEKKKAEILERLALEELAKERAD